MAPGSSSTCQFNSITQLTYSHSYMPFPLGFSSVPHSPSAWVTLHSNEAPLTHVRLTTLCLFCCRGAARHAHFIFHLIGLRSSEWSCSRRIEISQTLGQGKQRRVQNINASTPCSDCDFLHKKRGDVELLPGLYHCTLAEKAWEKVPVIRRTSFVTV